MQARLLVSVAFVTLAGLIAHPYPAGAGRRVARPPVRADQLVRVEHIAEEIRAPVRRQLARIARMKGQHEAIRPVNGRLTAIVSADQGESFRAAHIALSGELASVTTNAKDGQFWYHSVARTPHGMETIREHEFTLSGRNKELIERGFEPGEQVTIKTTERTDRRTGTVARSRTAKAIRLGGLGAYQVQLPAQP